MSAPHARRLVACVAAALLVAAASPAAAKPVIDPSDIARPTVVAASPLLTDDFEDGRPDGWRFAGGRWALSTDDSRVLRQSSSGTEHARAVAGDAAWTGYALTARVKPTSLGGGRAATGIAARVSGDAGYLLALRPGNRVELIRSAAGRRTVLATAGLTVQPGNWYALSLRATGNQLEATASGPAGTVTLTATDAALAAGAVAVFTDRAAASFDDVSVEDVPDTRPPLLPGETRLLDVTPTTATITWDPGTDNVGVTGYVIYFGAQFYEDYPVQRVTGNAPVTLPLYSSTGATLHFSVRAVDAAGNMSPPNVRVFFPQPPSYPRTGQDTVPPSAPGTPRVTGGSAGGVTITWEPAADDTGVVEYHVVHAFNTDEIQVRAKVPGSATSAVLPIAGPPNAVSIIAYDASWNSARSPTMYLLPTVPPTPPFP